MVKVFKKNASYMLISLCFYQVEDGGQYKREVRLVVGSGLRRGRYVDALVVRLSTAILMSTRTCSKKQG